MKKIVLVYAIAAFIACSCTGMQEAPEISGVPMVLTAYQEGTPDTKTAVEDGGQQVFWEPGDEIKVFSGSRSGKFTSSAESLEAVTTFTGHLEGNEPDVADIWAVYPYSDEASFDGETITTVIPSVQVARPGTFAQGANVAIAHSTTTSLQFYNVGGGIRFSLTEESVSKVIFEGLGGEVISGTVKVGFEEGLPKVKEVSGGSIFITLTPPDGETFATGTWYYLTAIPCALEQGLKIRFYKQDTYAKIVSEKAYTIKRRVFGSVQNTNQNIEYEPVTTNFPETEEEIEESIDMAEDIASISKNIIDNVKEGSGNGEIDANTVAEELEQIEGVESATPNELGTSIVVKQTNGVYINVILQSFADDFVPSTKSLGPVSVSHQTYSKAGSLKCETKKSSGKKALILMPVYDEAMSCFMQFDIYDYGKELYGHFKQYLENCGYDVEELINQKATLERFRGNNLQNYDFVLIHSHGGYNLRPVNGMGEYTGWMTASTVTDGTGKRFFNVTDFCDESIGCYDGKLHYWITSEAIKHDRPIFNDTFFYIFACHGAKKADMYSYLFERGAIAYCGHTDKANKIGSPVVADRMLYALSSGLSLDKAYEWTLNHSFKYDGSVPNWDLIHFDYLQKEYDGPIHIVDPHPYNIQSSVSGNQVKFTWEQAKTSGNYRYTVHIINTSDSKDWGQLFEANSTKEYTISNLIPGDYRWFVRAHLVIDGETIASYESEADYFTIDDEQGPTAVDLGLSVKWASFNLGASKPDEYGDYFAWGDISPQDDYRWSTYKWCNGNRQSLTKYNTSSSSGTVDNKTVLDPEDDAAHVNWGECWRMPTYDDWMELQNNCTLTWVDNYNGTGVAGEIVTSNKAGYKDKSIFLPAAGQRYATGWRDSSSMGYYWSSSLDTDYHPYNAWYILFDSNGLYKNYDYRYLGFSIRPVFTE